VAKPLIKVPFDQFQADWVAKANQVNQSTTRLLAEEELSSTEFLTSLPCVLYECDIALKIKRVSPNSTELIGVSPENLVGTRALWEDRVLREDLGLLAERINDLEISGSASIIHRLVDDRGLPVWVAHSLRRFSSKGNEVIRGCIIPMMSQKHVQDLDGSVISRFVHKIGNHFQLLNLVINSLRKVLPESRETEVLQQTVEKAIELTRSFSDYSQGPTCFSEVDLLEILNGATATRKSSFARRGVAFEIRLDGSLRGVALQGDPFLLEQAIGSVLQNSLEATEEGGRVILEGKVGSWSGSKPSTAKLRVVDTGCGIKEEDLNRVTMPFCSSKKNHDGLGLSMASRFVEAHGGILQINSLEGKGTEVQITLPTVLIKRPFDR